MTKDDWEKGDWELTSTYRNGRRSHMATSNRYAIEEIITELQKETPNLVQIAKIVRKYLRHLQPNFHPNMIKLLMEDDEKHRKDDEIYLPK